MKLTLGLTHGVSACPQLGGCQPKQLLVALVVSCLLHAALFLSPEFKGHRSALNVVTQNQKSMVVRRLTKVKLTYNHAPTAATPAPVKVKPVVADLPAPPLSPDYPATKASEPVSAPMATSAPYYTAEQLTKHAYPSSAVELDLSDVKLVIGSGRVVLKLWINNLGVLTDIEVEKTELPDAISDLAIKTFRAAHFVPGEINGQPVDSLMRIEINYGEDELDLP